MEWIKVKSSNIEEVSYSKNLLKLSIRFIRKGNSPQATYNYHPVPKRLFDEMIVANSIGGYFAKNIKGLPNMKVTKTFDEIKKPVVKKKRK